VYEKFRGEKKFSLQEFDVMYVFDVFCWRGTSTLCGMHISTVKCGFWCYVML